MNEVPALFATGHQHGNGSNPQGYVCAGKYSQGVELTPKQVRDEVGFNPYHYGYTFEASVNADGEAKVKKHYAMGRRAGSGVTVMPDGKTVYMTDASRQATLSKFVASEAGSLASGELFCAKFVAIQPSSVIVRNWLAGFAEAEQRSMTAHAGDTIHFTWAAGTHDVWLLKDQTAFATCDFTDAVQIDTASPTPYTVLEPGTTYYFSCNIPNHCNNGQKLAVTVAPSKPRNVQQPAPNHGNLDYNRAGVSDDQSSYSIEWISMGHADDYEIEEMIEPTRFQDLFEDAGSAGGTEGANDKCRKVKGRYSDGTNTDDSTIEARDGYRHIWADGSADGECLRLKPGKAKLASRFETQRYAAYLGCTTELSNTQGITSSFVNNQLYVAMFKVVDTQLAPEDKVPRPLDMSLQRSRPSRPSSRPPQHCTQAHSRGGLCVRASMHC